MTQSKFKLVMKLKFSKKDTLFYFTNALSLGRQRNIYARRVGKALPGLRHLPHMRREMHEVPRPPVICATIRSRHYMILKFTLSLIVTIKDTHVQHVVKGTNTPVRCTSMPKRHIIVMPINN